jgi:FkbM family methyltransferase
MFKNTIRYWCQQILGFDRYLFLFSLFNIYKIEKWGTEKEFRFFSGMIDGSGVILDIGANIGVMTVILAKQHPSSTIFSFEPMVANSNALKKVVQFYKRANVQIFDIALGNQTGEAQMVMPHAGHSRMPGLSHIVETGEEGKSIFQVPIEKMDSLPILQEAARISAVKMDVENFEYHVLKGGEALLRKHRPLIFCELWNDERRHQCFALLKEWGYRVQVFEKGRLVDFNGQEALNFFFLP